MKSSWADRMKWVAIPFVFVVVSFLIYHDAINVWWTFDDPYILELAIFQNPLDFFLKPDVYQRLSVANFTPLVITSYAWKYHLFGFAPQWFYLCQILLLGFLAFELFLIVNQKYSIIVSAWAGLLFLLSGPAALSSHVLMTCHYLEGACLSLLSILLLLNAAKSGINRQYWLAGFAYLTACLCKEVYVPLVLIVPFLIDGSWSKKGWAFLPFFCVLTVYIPWRFWMLGNFGGYGQLWWPELSWHGIVNGWLGICASFWSWQSKDILSYMIASGYFAIFTLTLLVLVKTRKINMFLLICMLIIGVLGPVVPVWSGISAGNLSTYRYLFHIAILVAIGLGCFFGYLLQQEIPRSWSLLSRIVIIFGMLAILVFTAVKQRKLIDGSLNSLVMPHARENLFFYREEGWKTLVAESKGHHWSSLAHFRQELQNSVPPAVCNEPFDFRDNSEAKYYRYNFSSDHFVDYTEVFTKNLKNFHESFAQDQQLDVMISIINGKFKVEIGPQEPKGQYHLLLGVAHDLYEDSLIPPVFSGQLYRTQHLFYIRIAKKLASGRWIISREWCISFNSKEFIKWSNLS